MSQNKDKNKCLYQCCMGEKKQHKCFTSLCPPTDFFVLSQCMIVLRTR